MAVTFQPPPRGFVPVESEPQGNNFLRDLAKKSAVAATVPSPSPSPPQEAEALRGLELLKKFPTAVRIYSKLPGSSEWVLKLMQRATHSEASR